jgi:anti-sigma factor ChrR (cupin superfamily)
MSEATHLDHYSKAMEFATGRLSSDEEVAFIREMESSPELQAEYDRVMNGISQIADGFVSAMPAPRKGLKDRVVEYATNKETAARSKSEIRTIVRSTDADWQQSGLPGITMKLLYADQATDRQTVLVRIAAGVHYPRHRHVGTEECLVIEGDLNMDDVRLNAGDFVVNADGDLHHDTWTEHGCTLLLTGSLHDDFAV